MIKPRTPPGVLELLPREQIAFQRMLDSIRGTFEAFGFLPIETPVMELSEVLLTKTGGDTERQVYFVQSTGGLEAYQNRLAAMMQEGGGISEKPMVMPPEGLPELALRFDLTVPLARYVAEHEHELAFPFRRYQMQRVYRGERQQRGRFREFYQCDIDVIGKDTLSIRHDAEIPAVIHAVFEALRIGEFTIQLNHRKLLRGFLEDAGVAAPENLAAVLRELDKLEKRGTTAVGETMTGGLGLDRTLAEKILRFAAIRARGQTAALAALAALDPGGTLFETGRAEMREVLQQLQALGIPESRIALNLSIARGLDYYTGMVYETVLDAYPQIGSICSGGRYEDLASHYSRSRLPGVGISIGLTRLFWQLREAGLLPVADSCVEVMVSLLDDADLPRSLALSQQLRAAGFNVETQLEPRKLARQLQYADRAGIRFVVIQGEQERERGVVAVKDLRRGEQFEVDVESLARTLRVEREQARASAALQPTST